MLPSDLNPGIRRTVEWLNANGFKTTDSGDGKTHNFECDQPIPYVHMEVDPADIASEAERLKALVEQQGVELLPLDEEGTIPTIQANYCPITGLASVSLWSVDDALLFGAR